MTRADYRRVKST